MEIRGLFIGPDQDRLHLRVVLHGSFLMCHFLVLHSGVSSPYSSATHQASSPFWQSHIALPRLRPSFVHANCDPSSLPLHDDRRASGPESRHGEAVKSDLPARPSAVGKREREKSRLPILALCPFSYFLSWPRPGPTPLHGVVSLALGTVASWSLGELSAFSLSSVGR